MPRKLTAAEQAARDAHFAEHPDCWMCKFLGRKQTSKTELHHIAGRGKRHEVRANFAALCRYCHEAIQSQYDAELVCLVLKLIYDKRQFNPEKVGLLRRRDEDCWNVIDVIRCWYVMRIMRKVMK